MVTVCRSIEGTQTPNCRSWSLVSILSQAILWDKLGPSCSTQLALATLLDCCVGRSPLPGLLDISWRTIPKPSVLQGPCLCRSYWLVEFIRDSVLSEWPLPGPLSVLQPVRLLPCFALPSSALQPVLLPVCGCLAKTLLLLADPALFLSRHSKIPRKPISIHSPLCNYFFHDSDTC